MADLLNTRIQRSLPKVKGQWPEQLAENLKQQDLAKKEENRDVRRTVKECKKRDLSEDVQECVKGYIDKVVSK